MSEPTDIRIESTDNGVMRIRLNRPEVRNALRTQTLTELVAALDEASADDAIGAVLLCGDDKAFAAGADVREMATLGAIDVWRHERPRLWQRIARFDKPLLAAVNGFCLGGGCELAMHADIIIAGETAQFGQPEVKLGIIPGAGGTQRLVRAVGKAMAMQMVLSGESIDAQTARQSGLVSEVVPADQTDARGQEVAERIARHPPLAVRAAKEMILQGFDTTLSAGLEIERRAFALLAASEDRNEGIGAFVERRKPTFRGR